jgi:dCTP diphosphatase
MQDFVELTAALRRFVAERDWSRYHDPKNLAMLVSSEAGELLAEYRWVRNEAADDFSREPEARARIAAEVGDVGLGLLLLCDRIGLDFVATLRDKLKQNELKYPAATSRGRADPPQPA